MQSQVSESNEQKNITQQPPKGGFKRFLLGYALINICITAIILALLWQGLEQYETCTPERIAVALANRLEEGNLSDFETAPQLQSTPFATQQDREIKVREAVQEKSLYTLKGKEEHEYQICNDEGAIAKISIVPTGEKTWMGFQKYQIEQPEILLALTQQYKIQCPIGTEILVNGETLGQEYQSGSEPIAGYQGIPEQYTVPQQITYQLETMTEPTVEASLEGKLAIFLLQKIPFKFCQKFPKKCNKKLCHWRNKQHNSMHDLLQEMQALANYNLIFWQIQNTINH